MGGIHVKKKGEDEEIAHSGGTTGDTAQRTGGPEWTQKKKGGFQILCSGKPKGARNLILRFGNFDCRGGERRERQLGGKCVARRCLGTHAQKKGGAD